MKTAAPTFREIRPDHLEVERDGKRIGSLSQVPMYSLTNAGLWRYYPQGEQPSPLFRDLAEAKQAIN